MASSRFARIEADRITYLEHFTCNICLEVLTEPVQCANNEHYFCKSCISEHLKRRQNCPVCRDNLTASTLRSPSRVVADMLQQMQSPKCRYVSRGCTVEVTYETFWSHHEECGFAPVECPYAGCSQSVNRQELSSHQENCEFRTVTCEDCREVMKPNEYRKHGCVLRRKIDENTHSLLEIKKLLQEMQAEQRRQGAGTQRLTNSASGQVCTTQIERRPAAEAKVTPSLSELSLLETSSCPVNETSSPVMHSNIFVAGGGTSYEVFNWATQTWTLYEDALFCDHQGGTSFIFNNKVMICGGRTDKVEYLDLRKNRAVSTFPMKLPVDEYGKGVLIGRRIFYFKNSISATSLKYPFQTKVLQHYDDGRTFESYGIALTNNRQIIILGGINQYKYPDQGALCIKSEPRETVLLYCPIINNITELAPLPYQLSHMAVVVHDNDVIILGGIKHNPVSSRKDVLKYNLTTRKSSKLPSMLKARSNFAAVILGDTIVAIGGDQSTESCYKTAEYLILGQKTWKELPPMQCERYDPTVCLMP